MSAGFSIVVPTYNRARLLEPTLSNIQSLRIPEGSIAELIVVDNNSPDDTERVVQAARGRGAVPVRKVVELKQGLCHSRNRGLREAQYDYVVFFDDDVEVAPEWLCFCLEASMRFGADCVVGPVFPRFEQSPPAWMSQAVLDGITSAYSRKGDTMQILSNASACELPGCNFAVRRQLALEIGGFDPALDRVGNALLAGGDFDLGRRLTQAGKMVVYHPGCSVRHLISKAKLDTGYLRRRWHGLGVTERYMRDKYRSSQPVSNRSRMLLGIARLAARSCMHLMMGHRATAFELELQARKAWGYWTGP